MVFIKTENFHVICQKRQPLRLWSKLIILHIFWWKILIFLFHFFQTHFPSCLHLDYLWLQITSTWKEAKKILLEEILQMPEDNNQWWLTEHYIYNAVKNGFYYVDFILTKGILTRGGKLYLMTRLRWWKIVRKSDYSNVFKIILI